jgi:hypothetical protein
MNEYSIPHTTYSSLGVNHESGVVEFNAIAKGLVNGERGPWTPLKAHAISAGSWY